MTTTPQFSVLTVSKRTGWEEMAKESIARQSIRPYRWIVIPEHYDPKILETQTYTRDVKIIVNPAPQKVRASNLNRSLNLGLKFVKTEYVIFYQDFIELPPNCFEKLLKLVDERTFVTTCTPNYDGSDDDRYTGLSKPRPCKPQEWEANVAIAPMKILRELGGFDEEYDNGWSWDNVNIAERAAMLGCKFIIDESNRPKLLDHEQTSKLAMETNGTFHTKNMKAIREGKKPLKLKYL